MGLAKSFYMAEANRAERLADAAGELLSLHRLNLSTMRRTLELLRLRRVVFACGELEVAIEQTEALVARLEA